MAQLDDLVPNLTADDLGGPRYLVLARQLARAIRDGHLPPGTVLPAQRQLADALGISRVTLQKALQILEGEQLLESRQGSGTFVSDRLQQPMTMLTSFSDDMRNRGRRPTSRWLDFAYGRATPEEALTLALSPSAGVFRLRRLRLADDEPMAIEFACLPAETVHDPAKIGDSLYAYLERRGAKPVRALEYLRARNLEAPEAAILGVAEGSAALFIRRISYLPDGRPIEYTRSFYRGDRYDFVAQMTVPSTQPTVGKR